MKPLFSKSLAFLTSLSSTPTGAKTMSVSTDLVTGIIQRALVYVVQKLVPGLVADVGGPFGLLLKAALGSQYAADLEQKLGSEAATWTGDKISALETECQAWVEGEFQKHPAFAAFVGAVKPQAPFDLGGGFTPVEMAAIKAAKADGTLGAKLGLAQ